MVNFEIVLATYNGSDFLEAQLNSILPQIGQGSILVHDDGSTDETVKLLSKYADNYDCIKIIKGPPCLSAMANFNFLLGHTTSSYIFFADQDDVWEDYKIEVLLKAITFYESVFGADVPLLVHSDLSLIDENNERISPSFWEYQKINPRWGGKFNLLLTQNVVTGCAMIVNRALVGKALPIPREAIMHDHWLALVASGFGYVKYIDDALVRYRQHGNNSVGAKSFDFEYILHRLLEVINHRKVLSEIQEKSSAQAKVFAERYTDSRSTGLAVEYSSLPYLSRIKRVKKLFKNRFNKIGVIRNVAWYLFV
ncbi:glycosyltransferase family 2 protein [Deinococcus radiopugnans]|uniref:glycosyltransferase family 2 protein n=1 Tax=Deinococcus radiopugnans TaxID=57497 RepID=UPI0009DDB533|nr:glycosyltransferase family 2 protein [Deinococcus radiopugnans]